MILEVASRVHAWAGETWMQRQRHGPPSRPQCPRRLRQGLGGVFQIVEHMVEDDHMEARAEASGQVSDIGDLVFHSESEPRR